jgi:hypothetical protein
MAARPTYGEALAAGGNDVTKFLAMLLSQELPNTPAFVAEDAPARKLVAIAPSDTTDLTVPARSLYIGTAGNVEVIAIDDTAPQIFTAVPAGTILPVTVKRVRAAGTSATGIIGLL